MDRQLVDMPMSGLFFTKMMTQPGAQTEALAGTGFETGHKGVMLVDARARIMLANQRAATLFETGNGLRLDDGSLSTIDTEASAKLERPFHAAPAAI